VNLIKKKSISIVTYRIALPQGSEIDLRGAYTTLSKTHKARYEPESKGIHGMHIKVNGITYLVFSNGSLCAYGSNTPESKQETFEAFWEQDLKKFLVFF